MTQIAQTQWMRWSEVPWSHGTEPASSALQISHRILELCHSATDEMAFWKAVLPEIVAEVSASWGAVFAKSMSWSVWSEAGRTPFRDVPYSFLEDALDRESGGFCKLAELTNGGVIGIPVSRGSGESVVLLLAGRLIEADSLPLSLAIGRVLEDCLPILHRGEGQLRRIERLRSTLHIASTLSSEHETQPLLELIAKEATRLLECDRASIFIWDREHHQVIACPALGVAKGTLRLPDNAGIVGEVLRTQQTVQVDDPYHDSRFNQSVDKASGYVTRNLLCGPLKDGQGKLIGAFEAINKNKGLFTEDDYESLEELGIQAAIALQNAREYEQLTRSRAQLAAQVTQGVQIIGESPAIIALRSTVDRLAATDLPALILGESGTGKEVVSQALHYHGPRSAHPFIAVNCAALTDTLLESELFGHEKGAFTDAHEARQGKFELAEGGTLFLDEIGDMSLNGQAKLLRVLEQKTVTRVGGSQSIPVNVRVVAATNRRLSESVRDKKFREDLYYRLSVVTLDLPALRDRPEDILLLGEFFLEKFCQQANRRRLTISAEAKKRLQAHGWPGNVRELRNLMERLAFLTNHDQVEADDLAFIISPERDSSLDFSGNMGLADATKKFQQEFIRRSIGRMRGNMSEAARLLGLHRSNLYRKMRQLEMTEAADLSDDDNDD
ncbi:MAG: sigma-54-dependent Fis family transcriptional regulator [Planctomycetota bacterium]|nr:sigma-54-dependent Fis family transcriptional regulator [Planctomycetota bacterium]MDA1212509.1 sigma-54-dependent Fis family transcriptional regulator [Planctomycetota bacterium]